jgi:hypothetical protein
MSLLFCSLLLHWMPPNSVGPLHTRFAWPGECRLAVVSARRGIPRRDLTGVGRLSGWEAHSHARFSTVWPAVQRRTYRIPDYRISAYGTLLSRSALHAAATARMTPFLDTFPVHLISTRLVHFSARRPTASKMEAGFTPRRHVYVDTCSTPRHVSRRHPHRSGFDVLPGQRSFIIP